MSRIDAGRLYRREFPDYDGALPDIRSMQDTSWHNDACPSFAGHGFKLWCDYRDPAKREFPGRKRFLLCDAEDDSIITESDDVFAILRTIEQ